MFRWKLSLVALLAFVSVVDAGPFRRGRRYVEAPQTQTQSVVADSPALVDKLSNVDALEEVNAHRARLGLRAFIKDAGLTKAAYWAAQHRALNGIAGHTFNDFSFLPEGTSATAAGCGAWQPGTGWGTCCSEENYTYAGAAWVIGKDGLRYMHLFVR